MNDHRDQDGFGAGRDDPTVPAGSRPLKRLVDSLIRGPAEKPLDLLRSLVYGDPAVRALAHVLTSVEPPPYLPRDTLDTLLAFLLWIEQQPERERDTLRRILRAYSAVESGSGPG